MNLSQIVMIMIFSVGMGFGQLLLKFSAERQTVTADANWLFRIYALFTDWAFLSGVLLYGALLIYWVWLLTFLPLSRAYPFTLMSLIVAAIGSAFLFNEPLTPQFLIGISIIGIGLAVLSAGL